MSNTNTGLIGYQGYKSASRGRRGDLDRLRERFFAELQHVRLQGCDTYVPVKGVLPNSETNKRELTQFAEFCSTEFNGSGLRLSVIEAIRDESQIRPFLNNIQVLRSVIGNQQVSAYIELKSPLRMPLATYCDTYRELHDWSNMFLVLRKTEDIHSYVYLRNKLGIPMLPAISTRLPWSSEGAINYSGTVEIGFVELLRRTCLDGVTIIADCSLHIDPTQTLLNIRRCLHPWSSPITLLFTGGDGFRTMVSWQTLMASYRPAWMVTNRVIHF